MPEVVDLETAETAGPSPQATSSSPWADPTSQPDDTPGLNTQANRERRTKDKERRKRARAKAAAARRQEAAPETRTSRSRSPARPPGNLNAPHMTPPVEAAPLLRRPVILSGGPGAEAARARRVTDRSPTPGRLGRAPLTFDDRPSEVRLYRPEETVRRSPSRSGSPGRLGKNGGKGKGSKGRKGKSRRKGKGKKGKSKDGKA